MRKIDVHLLDAVVARNVEVRAVPRVGAVGVNTRAHRQCRHDLHGPRVDEEPEVLLADLEEQVIRELGR